MEILLIFKGTQTTPNRNAKTGILWSVKMIKMPTKEKGKPTIPMRYNADRGPSTF